MSVDWIGWVATGVQTTSYFVPSTATLKKIQAAAACLWIAYGVKMGTNPVIAANLIVGAAALFTALRNRNHGTNAPQFLTGAKAESTINGD